MSFAEVLAAANELTADERRQLARELTEPMPPAFRAWADSGQALEMHSPLFAPEAAAVLLRLLEQERAAR